MWNMGCEKNLNVAAKLHIPCAYQIDCSLCELGLSIKDQNSLVFFELGELY
jgi:hypothetical protein